MTLRTKLLFAASTLLMVVFCFNVSDAQYRRRIAHADRTLPAYARMDPHAIEDDIVMGAGFYPWVSMFIPSILLLGGAGLSWSFDKGWLRTTSKPN